MCINGATYVGDLWVHLRRFRQLFDSEQHLRDPCPGKLVMVPILDVD
jgi:hypothetical protein